MKGQQKMMMSRFCLALAAIATAQASHAQTIDCSAFQLNTDASWSLVKPTDIQTRTGPVHLTPGMRFKTVPAAEDMTPNMEIARALNANCR
jgi:hypothetical protein